MLDREPVVPRRPDPAARRALLLSRVPGRLPGSYQSARSQPFFVPKTAPSASFREWSGESRFRLPASDTSSGYLSR